jgi:hypothetical protein
MVVKDELTKLGLKHTVVELGEVELLEAMTPKQHDEFKAALLKSGLELLDDKKVSLFKK